MRVEIYINSRHRIIYLRESENELINSIKVKLKNLIWKRKNKNKVTSLSKRKKTSFYVIHVRVDSAYELYGQRHFNVHNLWMLSAAEIQQGKGVWCLRGDGHRDVLIWFHIYLVFTLFINVLFSGFVFVFVSLSLVIFTCISGMDIHVLSPLFKLIEIKANIICL